jgi:HEPN domain-containing protein
MLLPDTLSWIEYAENDYQASLVLFNLSKPPIEIIAYHYQQMAEKYLKSYIIQLEKDYPRTHDLSVLNKMLLSNDDDFASISEFCERLAPFGTVIRHPDSGMIIDTSHLTKIQDWAVKIRSFIRAKLGLDS